MQNKVLGLVIALLAAGPGSSYALTFDVRGGYKAGSHSYESRYKVSESWKTG
ncbi:hypothetical protein MUU46_17490 [Scandinavium sp. TWS1a]|uniref:hypothetical protein n=1 Tax=Scandinavium tedordense TaxID=2926521 RepID=UPI002165CD26|nr:hypothetical protein [Scandinavium tedordense]MCS2172088.1 hypothetical protein [Scandinavium tedordense]